MYLEIKVSKLLTNVVSVSMSSCSTRERFSKVSFVAGGGGFGPIVSKLPREHWYCPKDTTRRLWVEVQVTFAAVRGVERIGKLLPLSRWLSVRLLKFLCFWKPQSVSPPSAINVAYDYDRSSSYYYIIVYIIILLLSNKKK